MSDKTEDPTPKRLRKAREEGDSGASAFAAQSLAFLAALAVLPAALRATATWSEGAMREAIAAAASAEPSLAVAPSTLALDLLGLVVPALLAVALTGAVSGVVQAGGGIATKKLAPDLGRLGVFKGLKGLFSTDRLFAVARALLGAAAVAYLAYRGLRDHAGEAARLSGRLSYLVPWLEVVARGLARDAALVGLALAVLDLVVTRRAWTKRLRMSKEEVKREHKESEGDPELKAARERAHHELLASATVANVRTATVVVVNPTHIACALRYDEKEGDEAPVVVASGEGDLAARIVRAAHDYGVPVVRDVPVARALRELEIGDAIPEALYEAIAEILRDLHEEEEQSA